MNNLKQLVSRLRADNLAEEGVAKVVEDLTKAATVEAMALVLESIGEDRPMTDQPTKEQAAAVFESKTGKKIDDVIVEIVDRLAGEFLDRYTKKSSGNS